MEFFRHLLKNAPDTKDHHHGATPDGRRRFDPHGPGRRFGQKGFTLFETLAATMILAIALVAIIQLFSGGLRSGHMAERYTRATLHAREKMEELLLFGAMTETTLGGRWADGYVWRADISSYPQPLDDIYHDGLIPFRVAVEVSWDDGHKQRRVTFETLALATRQSGR